MVTIERAQTLADEVLFPAASAVDAGGTVPRSHFDLLAQEGFYALAAPEEHGGQGLTIHENARIFEALAGGCLTTAFVWAQHHGVVRGLATTDRVELRERHLADAVRGTLRGGVSFAGAIPQPPRLHAVPVDGGYRLDGEAPFVSGWGLVDVLQLSARHGDLVVNGLVEARPDTGIRVEPLDLVAAQGTSTVRLWFDGYFLPADRILGEVPHAAVIAAQAGSSRLNGSLPLGLAGRCARLIAEAGRREVADQVEAERDAVRNRLDKAFDEGADISPDRAAAADLALRAAGAVVTAAGSSALLLGAHGQRLVREATFTLVAASRPPIKDGILSLLAGGVR
ncbi:acyl-CoA dehydrogenase family protein [Saccharopolyspora gloriosae]|uniref:acyl-CoA dehydrogenase family protein n=1 Tax=Saccharopolyspora gloriosae TaxID=455344 RepID=UPI001FB85DC3|nr:acyl-CoA dehydrogenase family protein [Saccharopolyspora gloriosae]